MMIVHPLIGAYNSSASKSILIDAAGEKAAFIIQAPKTGSIRKVGFYTTTVTTGDTIDVRIETVDSATGMPTGTLWGTNTNISHVVNNTDDNVWLTTSALTANASVSKGDVLAVVFVNGAAGNMNIGGVNEWGYEGFPYVAQYTASWAKLTNMGVRVVLEYSDGTTPNILGSYPWSGEAASDSSTSSTLYRGCEITLPFAATAIGMWATTSVAGSGTVTAKLFSSDGSTALAAISKDTDQQLVTSVYPMLYMFTAPVALNANTKYWLAVASDGTRNLNIYYQTYNSTAIRDEFAPAGSGLSWSQATSPTAVSSWTNTSTRVPLMGLILSEIKHTGTTLYSLYG